MDWFDIGAKAIETGANLLLPNQAVKQQSKIMDLQVQNQMKLNEQGQALQLDTWEKTNLPAQVEQAKKAGLNPALLYSKGGAGGTTGSQSGGSASGGSAPHWQPMNLASMLEMSNLRAQNQLLQSEKDKTDAERKEIEARTPTHQSAIEKIKAETKNEQLKGDLITWETMLKRIESAYSEQEITANLQNLGEATRSLRRHTDLLDEQFNTLVKEAGVRVLGKEIENTLTQSKISLTETEQRAITTKLVQEWTKLGLEGRKLDQNDKEIAIKNFEAEIRANYPNLTNVSGRIAQKAYEALEFLLTLGTGGRSAIPEKSVK